MPNAGRNSRPGGLPANTRYQTPDGVSHHQIRERLDAEVAAVRAEMARVDPKAASFQQLGSVVLGAGLAVLAGVDAGGHLSSAAVAAGTITALVVLAAVVLLALASRPRLDGDFGFVTYAGADVTAEDILGRAAASAGQPLPLLHKARELRWLSRVLKHKYTAIGWAVPLLIVGYVGAAITTAIALWGR